MKKILSTKNISIIAITAFIVVLSSCKKIDSGPTISSDDQAAIAKIKQDVSKQMEKEGGIPQIYTKEIKTQTQWVDQNRNPVTKEQMENNFTSVCNYDLPSICNLVQYSRVFRCAGSGSGGPGYFIQFEYYVSWNNNIIKDDGNGNLTSGFVEIVSDATSNVVQTLTLDNNNSEVIIDDLGPGTGGNNLFRVRFISTDFNTQLVQTGYINGDISGTYTVKLSALFVTDCVSGGDPYSLWSLPATLFGFTGNTGEDPCDRNEKAWFNYNQGGSYANRFVISGYDLVGSSCGYGSPFIRPDLQEVEYSINGGANWLSFINDITASGEGIDGSAFIRKDDVARSIFYSSGTYNVIVRYRNWKYIGTNPSGWPTPDFNNDCFSPGDDPTNNTNSLQSTTFAYKYYPSVTF